MGLIHVGRVTFVGQHWHTVCLAHQRAVPDPGNTYLSFAAADKPSWDFAHPPDGGGRMTVPGIGGP
jgi:hypothetical protein